MVDIQNFASHVAFLKTPDGIAIRYGYWPCSEKKNGIVVLLNGRSEFLEKYIEPIGMLNSKGFDVFSLDWRGQGLSDRLLPHRHKGFVPDFGDYLIDLHAGLCQIVFPKADKPIFFLAHSMGGHIALRYLLTASDANLRHLHAMDDQGVCDQLPELIRGGILSSPMIHIRTAPFPGWFVKKLSFFMVKTGRGARFAVGSGDYHPEDQAFKGNPLTSDPKRFFDHVNAVRNNPDLALGGVTYAWLKAAYDSIFILEKSIRNAQKPLPILMAGAECDRIVSVKAQKAVSRMLPNCEFKLMSGAQHEILKETDAIQGQFWSEFDSFVGKML